MKSNFLLPRIAVGMALGVVTAGSGALTLGRAQGVALIGRPLEVSVPVTFDAGEVQQSQCPQAEVFYGDARVDPSRVAVDTQSGGGGAVVRVQSSQVLNEPVVTVYLNLGCGTSRFTRRFVLLAEHPDPLADPTPVARPGAPAAARVAQAPAGVRGPAGAAGAEGGAAPSQRPRGAASAPRRDVQRAPARLKLEPLDLSPARDPSLRLSGELPALQAGSNEQRALAAALWRAINAKPEDLLRDAQRIEALEKDMASLRQSMERSDAAVASLRTELEAARAQRYANPVVFGLLGLLLLAAAAAAYAWRRGRWGSSAGGDWWRTRDGADSELPPIAAATGGRRGPNTNPGTSLSAQHGDPDLSLTESMDDMDRGPATRPHADAGDFYDEFQQGEESMLAVRAEELHDVQQEADFFLSLGDHDRAIEVLRNHISMNPDTSAVAWLDLLEIHHKLQRREDFDALRTDFLRNFNVQVPDFDNYREGQSGLEDYDNAIARITALWPSRKVLDLIEESIFREPGHEGAEAFSLEAYRDLLLLHHIGRDVLQFSPPSDTRSPAGTGFSNTAMHPLSAQSTIPAAPVLTYPHLGQDLDVNLDDLDGPAEHSIGDAASDPLPPVHGNLLDFDLPASDIEGLRAKKSRE